MDNREFNISQKLEGEIDRLGDEEDINEQFFHDSDLVDYRVEAHKATPSHPIIENSDETLQRNDIQLPAAMSTNDEQPHTTQNQLTSKEKLTSKGQPTLPRELRLLESYNVQGTRESLPLVTRSRHKKPILKTLHTTWQHALTSIEEELTCFHEQRFDELNTDNTYQPRISSRYKDLKARMGALECSAKDYVFSLYKEGYREGLNTIHNVRHAASKPN